MELVELAWWKYSRYADRETSSYIIRTLPNGTGTIKIFGVRPEDFYTSYDLRYLLLK